MTSIEYRVYQAGMGFFRLVKYEVTKVTPCGRWVLNRFEKPHKARFVRNSSDFCSPTIEGAIQTFFKRKAKEVERLEERLRAGQHALTHRAHCEELMLHDFIHKGRSNCFEEGDFLIEHC